MMKNKRSAFERVASSPYIVWSAIFIIAPLLFVAYFAFTDRDGNFTFENILSLSSYSETFIMSLGFSLIATTVCLLIGYPLAYCMSRTSERTRSILMVLLMLPMWISLLIRTYSLMEHPYGPADAPYVDQPSYQNLFSYGASLWSC